MASRDANFFYSLCEQIVKEIQWPPLPLFVLGQQEQLLLSVLPRYIAMELKTEVINKLFKPKSEEKKETNSHNSHSSHNFYSLYVRKHNDVRWWSSR